MKRALSSFALTLVVAVLCVPMARAEGLSSLWPWGGKDTKQTAPKRTAQKPVTKSAPKPKAEGNLGLKWPSLPGFSTAKKPAARKTQSPSVLTRMNKSTKNFFAKTKNALTPGSNKPVAKKMPPTGSQGIAKRSAKPAADKPSGNILTSWWMPAKKEEKRPKSPSEWIGGERP